MAWFLPSHIDQGLIFGCLGLWHIFSTLRLYIRSPDRFQSRAWFPAARHGALRCAELWTLLFIVVVFIIKQMSHAVDDLTEGVIHAEHLMRFQHVSFSLFFLLYLCVALLHETTNLLPLPEGVLTGTFALGFLTELVVFHFGHHPGDNLESYVHMLIQLILAALVLMMFMEIAFPESFMVAIARAMLLTFKGTWFFNIGLLINFSSFVPLGCAMTDDSDFPDCPLSKDNMRAKAIQVLILVVQAVGIVAFTFSLYFLLLAGSAYWPSKALLGGEIKPLLTDPHHSAYLVGDRDGEFSAAADEGGGLGIAKELSKSLSKRVHSLASSPLSRLSSPLPHLQVHSKVKL